MDCIVHVTNSLSETKVNLIHEERKQAMERIRLKKATECKDDKMGSLKQVNSKVGMHT
jgi:hypothetical protein